MSSLETYHYVGGHSLYDVDTGTVYRQGQAYRVLTVTPTMLRHAALFDPKPVEAKEVKEPVKAEAVVITPPATPPATKTAATK